MEWRLIPLLFTACLMVVNAKIVYLNGTEIFNGRLRSLNLTTAAPQKWISVFNPRNISNHSGSNSKPYEDRKNDEEEATVDEIDGDENGSPQTGMATSELENF